MHARDIFNQTKPTFSFEFFPPKNENSENLLLKVLDELAELKPDFVSMTYGAGGGTREETLKWVRLLIERKLDPIAHLTCVCHSEAEIESLLETYAADGLCNILALGGDLPRDRQDWDRGQDAFRYASDLVSFIRQFADKNVHADERGFGIGVAGFPEGHPGTPNRLKEMDYLKAKVDAGADYICTQLFFDNRDFYDFRDRCELAGINIPIIAGILPVATYKGMSRMADLAGGARFPAGLMKRVLGVVGSENENDAVSQIGIEWASEQSEDLLKHGVDGIHFYTLNQSRATIEIYKALNLVEVK